MIIACQAVHGSQRSDGMTEEDEHVEIRTPEEHSVETSVSDHPRLYLPLLPDLDR